MSRHTGYAHLPLHPGRAPAWLFTRMTRLAREIAVHIVADQGTEQLLRRLSDPFWFQAFGCVLGFDWHSSGVTTTVTGALKEGLADVGGELGLYAQGGKGATSRKTPAEISARCERLNIDPQPLVYASRMAAKVDSAAVQDGYQLYHHAFFFTKEGHWCVVQQGMNDATRTARRYHWLSESLTSFVSDPHAAICSDNRGTTLNLVALEHASLRTASLELATAAPDQVVDVVRRSGAGRKSKPGLNAGRLPFEESDTESGQISSTPLPKIEPGVKFREVPTLDMPAGHVLGFGTWIPGTWSRSCSRPTSARRRRLRRSSGWKALGHVRYGHSPWFRKLFTGRRSAPAIRRGSPSHTGARTGRPSPSIARPTIGPSTFFAARWPAHGSTDPRNWMRSSVSGALPGRPSPGRRRSHPLTPESATCAIGPLPAFLGSGRLQR